MYIPILALIEVYKPKLAEILGNYDKCTRESRFCDGCKLFGYVEDDSSQVQNSKIKFTDATPETFKLANDYVLLDELSSPKISALEFYLDDQGYYYFTYEYAFGEDKEQPIKNYTAKLKGRKVYLSHKGCNLEYISDTSILAKDWENCFKDKKEKDKKRQKKRN